MALRTAAALSEKKTKAMPGGVIKPFWQAETIISTPQSSILNSSQPRLAMQSTINNALWPLASMAPRRAEISLRTEVDVSTCTAITALIRPAVSARRWSRTRSISIVSRPPKSMVSTVMPRLLAISPQPMQKRPVAKTSTLSPTAKTLDTAASQAP